MCAHAGLQPRRHAIREASIILSPGGIRCHGLRCPCGAQVYAGRMFDRWDELRRIRKPLVGAINGYALGGGCELAMMCDIIIASETASFGQVSAGYPAGSGGGAVDIRGRGDPHRTAHTAYCLCLGANSGLNLGWILRDFHP